MAERVVDRLEAVEVEEEDRAAVLTADRADQRIVERPAKRLAVGEAGQRILPREAVELDLRLAHFREIGSKAAEAEKAPDLVMHRRPVIDHQISFLVLARTIRSWNATWEDK